jgi:protein arginine kinase
VLVACKVLQEPMAVGMAELSVLDKQMLCERHLISREQADRKKGSGLVLRLDEAVAVMVNEEDHLRLQSMRPGLDLAKAWEVANTLDSEVEKEVAYAFSPKIGYLTACPSNVGTGMRASVMLHVPGLVLMNEINAVVKGMAKIGLAVRGLWGEGSEATGNMFQVSNQMTLGEREVDIVANLEQIVLEIVEHEKNARLRLFEKKANVVRDHAGRALGILSNAHVLTSKECLDLLSDLRLGVDMGILTLRDRSVVNDLLILTQPGHLQKLEGRKLKAEERDVARAMLVRSRLKKALNKSNTKQT